MKIKRLIQATLVSAILTVMIVAPGASAAHSAAPDGLYSIQSGWCRAC